MRGREGTYAVALDLLTAALAMVGQHGGDCRAACTRETTSNIALVVEQIGDGKSGGRAYRAGERRMSEAVRRGGFAHYNMLESWSMQARRAVPGARHASGPPSRAASPANSPPCRQPRSACRTASPDRAFPPERDNGVRRGRTQGGRIWSSSHEGQPRRAEWRGPMPTPRTERIQMRRCRGRASTGLHGG